MAKLLNADRAQIDESKLVDYLLSPTHPRGYAKAEFFGRFGFRREVPEAFRLALEAHAQQCEVLAIRDTEFGVIAEVAGPLRSPDGRDPLVVVVWAFRSGEDWPRLVTVIPWRGS